VQEEHHNDAVIDSLIEKEAVCRGGDVVLLVFQSHHVQVEQVPVHLAVARRRVPPAVRQHPNTLRTLMTLQPVCIYITLMQGNLQYLTTWECWWGSHLLT